MNIKTNFLGGTTEPHKINQAGVNNVVRDQNLTKGQAELLASRQKDWNLLQGGTKMDVLQDEYTRKSTRNIF
jgi:hypothetical protein